MAIPLEELQAKQGFTTAHARARSRGCRSRSGPARRYTVISVDDHIVEPPDAFAGGCPAKFADARAARRRARRRQRGLGLRGAGAAERRLQRGRRPAGRRSTASNRPASTRCAAARGTSAPASPTWTSTACTRRCASRRSSPDSPASGSSSSPTIPSSRWPACGRGTTGCIEDWAAYAPGRMIPLQIPYLLDPEIGAEEVRRNAARGFKAMTFSEAPHMLGLPVAALAATGTRSWPRARRPAPSCACTSARRARRPRPRPTRRPTPSACCSSGTRCSPPSTGSTRASRCASPISRICLSEGGIGWVAGLLDRLEHVRKYDAMYGTWNDVALSPADTFRRNFWVCAIDDPSAFLQRDVIGIEQHPRRVRLPARRLDLAAHAGTPRGAARRAVRRRGRARHLGERVGAVPPPGARRGAA